MILLAPVPDVWWYVIILSLVFSIILIILVLTCRISNIGFSKDSSTYAFFHPYPNNGGGGEQVLWMWINSLLLKHGNIEIVIYTVPGCNMKETLVRVRDSFHIDLTKGVNQNKIRFIPIYTMKYIESYWYPFATMICQSLVSMLIAIECMIYCIPNYYIDTVGAPFTYPVVYLLSFPCHITAYVHYPVISSDMLKSVAERRPIYNNNECITSSTYISSIKLSYYLCFAKMYQFMGRFATEVVVNSKWTQYHIEEIWQTPVSKIYPPCKTNIWRCCTFWIKKVLKRRYILSIGQFRQEKNHELQLRSWRLFKDIFGSR